MYYTRYESYELYYESYQLTNPISVPTRASEEFSVIIPPVQFPLRFPRNKKQINVGMNRNESDNSLDEINFKEKMLLELESLETS